MEQLIPILIQLISGAAGGNVVGGLLKNIDLSKVLRTILGIVGGGQLAALIPALTAILGADGGGAMVGQAGAGAVGGGLLTLLVGLIKKAMAGKV